MHNFIQCKAATATRTALPVVAMLLLSELTFWLITLGITGRLFNL